MTCSACSNGLEKYLNKQKVIHRAEVNLVMATALIEYDDNLKIEDLNKMVQGAGFKSLGERNDKKEKRNELKKVIIFSILGVILMYISMGAMINLPVPEIIDMNKNPIIYSIVIAVLSLTFLIYGFDIIKNGVKNIIHKMPNMDSLVGIGVIVNFLYSLWNTILVFQGQTHLVHHLYFESSAIIILFVKIGRYIDGKNKNKAVDSIKNLVTITPKNGTILKDGKEKTVTINEIEKGDIVICKPGEKIAVDGKVTKGETHTDESFITGESKPVTKKVGSKVLAGSINYDGYIEYEAERIGKDSSISQIVNLVVEATNTKAPIARLADKISGYFVPAIIIIAILGLNITSYSSGNTIFSLETIKNILPSIQNTYITFIDFYFSNNILNNTGWYRHIFYAILFVLILLNFIVIIINRKIYKTPAKVIFLLLGILLFPIFACSIELIAQSRNINLLMATSLYLPIVVLIKQIELLQNSKFNNIIQILSYFISVLIIWTFILSNNATYIATKLYNDQMFAVGNRILERIENNDEITANTPIVVLGHLDFSIQNETLLELTNFDVSDINIWTWQIFLQDHLGIGRDICTMEDYSELMNSEDYINMPIYPNEGCIKLINGIAVVKLNY